MTRRAAIHYLRHNAAERSPRRVITLDTETSWHTEGDREVHRMRLWCARLDLRADPDEPAREPWRAEGRALEELPELVDRWTTSSRPTWLFTHNLSFDLTVTTLPVLLLQDGWELGRHNLASEQPWAHLSRRSRSLQLADSHSWLPRAVKDLGELLGVPKLELPDEDDSDEAWFQRCRRDVEITALAVRRLMDQWDRHELGSWSLTGPASAWNSMLHMAPGHPRRRGPQPGDQGGEVPAGAPVQRTVIDPEPHARAFERQAIYSGRRDVWRWGQQRDGDFTEVDFHCAHLTIAATSLLPARRGDCFQSLELDDWHIGARSRSVLAQCMVETPEPRYPLRYRNAVWHPVGRFWTTLCGPELVDARNRGHLLRIGPGYTYRLGNQMQPWAQWALAQLDAPPGHCDPILHAFLKMASRSVPGRWGMMIGREFQEGPSHVLGWELERAAFGRPPRLGAILHLAGRWQSVVRDQEADDAFPAVLAHIQAWDRVYLQRGLDRLPEGAALQCNTDSVVIHSTALEELAAGALGELEPELERARAIAHGTDCLSAATAPLEFRIKRRGQRCLVLSPQHVDLAGERKFSGVPKGAIDEGGYAYTFWTWPKLPSQLAHREQGAYVREKRTVHLAGVPIPRWAFECGCTLPPRAGVTWGGATELVGPDAYRCEEHGTALRPAQHPVLARLL